MLSWFTAPKTSDDAQQDQDATAFDHPDTPAHVFAARAFQYRLWGTPKPPETVLKTGERSRSLDLDRPQATAADPASPSKLNGILLTPGTANPKRSKTVSFGVGAQDHEQKSLDHRSRSMERNRSGPTVPGGFPSPSKVDITGFEGGYALPQRSTTLTQKFQHARAASEPGSRSARSKQSASEPLQKVTEDQCHAAIDWKDRYDQYSARTEREMKRLIAKQQAAKHYAREKDTAAIQLAEDLKEERRKIRMLESQISTLNEEVVRMQKDLIIATRRAAADPSRSINDYDPPSSKPAPPEASRAGTRTPPVPKRSPARRPSVVESKNDTDVWASFFLPSSPAEEPKSKFEDDLVSSHLRRTRLQTRQKDGPEQRLTDKPLPPRPLSPKLQKPRNIYLGSTTPQQKPPSPRRRSGMYSASSRRRNVQHTPVRVSAPKVKLSSIEGRGSKRATQKQESATKLGLFPKPRPESDFDVSLYLEPPSPAPSYPPPPIPAPPLPTARVPGVSRSVRPQRALASDSSPFITDPKDYARRALGRDNPADHDDDGDDDDDRRPATRRAPRGDVTDEGGAWSPCPVPSPSPERLQSLQERESSGCQCPLRHGSGGLAEAQGTQKRSLDAERLVRAQQRIAARRQQKKEMMASVSMEVV